jgi:hypothetical protein
MLGFDLDIWDYLTFATLFLAVVAGVAFWVWLAELPGRIAIRPQAPGGGGGQAARLDRPAADHLSLGPGCATPRRSWQRRRADCKAPEMHAYRRPISGSSQQDIEASAGCLPPLGLPVPAGFAPTLTYSG